MKRTKEQKKHSIVCLIDKQGNSTTQKIITSLPIVREAKPAAKWDAASRSYKVVYPSGKNNLAILKVSENTIEKTDMIRGNKHPVLKNIRWPQTGISSLFMKDNDGQDLWYGKNIVLFVTNSDDSNDPLYVPIEL
jgi:hypothetical protein